jgi:hypothetical protein
VNSRIASLVLAVAIVPLAVAPADAATRHRHHKAKRATVVTRAAPKRGAAAPAPAAMPAPAAPAVTSVISIGGYVFYDLTYAQAVQAYQAAVAAAAPGFTPPATTSVSVTTTVGSG